jgi:inhibitor of cysteine peptidase
MEKRLYFVCCLLGVIFSAVCCSGMGTAQDTGYQKAMTITQGDNGKQVSVETGDEFTIELKELATAGYGWYIDNLDKEHLELVSEKLKVISEGKVGAPVMAAWLFRAKKKGSTEIKMDLYRAWEGKGKTIEHFSVKIVIE